MQRSTWTCRVEQSGSSRGWNWYNPVHLSCSSHQTSRGIAWHSLWTQFLRRLPSDWKQRRQRQSMRTCLEFPGLEPAHPGPPCANASTNSEDESHLVPLDPSLGILPSQLHTAEVQRGVATPCKFWCPSFLWQCIWFCVGQHLVPEKNVMRIVGYADDDDEER